MQILKENELKSPFDLREMTWYIIPGVTLILMIFLFELWMATEIKEIKIFSKEKNSSDSTSINSKELKILENNSLKDSILKSAEINTIEKLKSTISQKELDSLLLDTKSKIIKEKISLLHTPVFTALLITHTGDNIFSNSWVLSALYLLLLLSICYLLGHVLYMVGTFIYERGLVSKGHNYPYIRLLQLKEHETKTEIEINSSKGFYKGIAFWITFFFVGYYVLKYSTDWSPIFFNSYVIITLICFILIPIRIKFILATLNEWEKFYDTAILARDNA